MAKVWPIYKGWDVYLSTIGAHLQRHKIEVLLELWNAYRPDFQFVFEDIQAFLYEMFKNRRQNTVLCLEK